MFQLNAVLAEAWEKPKFGIKPNLETVEKKDLRNPKHNWLNHARNASSHGLKNYKQ